MIPPPAGGSAADDMNGVFDTVRIGRQAIGSMNVNPRLCLWQSLQQVVGSRGR